ncbi:protease inhibitor I42 family protein [uncultured Acetobacteroides sp.]|uniref:protease inhibitor I42 family protein n=1 Tax=uncultured Acetobacteroides sp. TaxID=1760811 RepID=UPI0029F4C9AA|nr:protease inhibitor I42 family protein [uncultured Acetobacteroides sp.]
MAKKIALLILMAIATLGAASAQEPKAPDPKPYYEIRKGGTITFRLLEHTGGGYLWLWKNRAQVSVVDSIRVIRWSASNTRKYGGPIYTIWKFRAVRSGIDTLRFEEQRVFQKNSTINTKVIVIRVR